MRGQAEINPTVHRSTIILRQRSISTPSSRARLSFGGRPLERGLQLLRRGFQLLMTPPHVSRGPVELAQAIQDRALDAMPGIAGEGHLLIGIEFRGRVE